VGDIISFCFHLYACGKEAEAQKQC